MGIGLTQLSPVIASQCAHWRGVCPAGTIRPPEALKHSEILTGRWEYGLPRQCAHWLAMTDRKIAQLFTIMGIGLTPQTIK